MKDTPDIYFAGNGLSTDALLELIALIGDRDFSVNVISKSGDVYKRQGQQLHRLAALIQGVPGGGILPGRVVHSWDGQLLHGPGRALHQGGDIDPRRGDGQQPYCCLLYTSRCV